MNIKDVLRKATNSLIKTSSTPNLDAEVLLTYVLKIPYENIILKLNDSISKADQKRYFKLIIRRKKYEPIAYITNNKEFFGLDFYVDKRVLIPRPETEIIVEEVLKIIKSLPRKKKISIADIGTGSGCIAISIVLHCNKCEVLAVDKSKNALKVTQKNIINHKVNSRIKLLHGNLLQPLKGKVDLITANLPYLTIEQIKATEKDVRKYEPKMALLAGKTETTLYEELISQVPNILNKDGFLLLEIDPLFSAQSISIVEKYLPGSTLSVIKDLSGKDRVLKIKI